MDSRKEGLELLAKIRKLASLSWWQLTHDMTPSERSALDKHYDAFVCGYKMAMHDAVIAMSQQQEKK